MKVSYISIFLALTSLIVICDDKNLISFNRLFQDSDYARVIDLCMQIWADLDGISTGLLAEKLKYEQNYDIQIARLSRVKFYCIRMSQGISELYYEDLDELLQIITLIQNRIELATMGTDDLLLLNELLLSIKQQIAQVIDCCILGQGEDPHASAKH